MARANGKMEEDAKWPTITFLGLILVPMWLFQGFQGLVCNESGLEGLACHC